MVVVKKKWTFVDYWFILNEVGQIKSEGGYYCIISITFLQLPF